MAKNLSRDTYHYIKAREVEQLDVFEHVGIAFSYCLTLRQYFILSYIFFRGDKLYLILSIE